MKIFYNRLFIESVITILLLIITVFVVFFAQGKVITPEGNIQTTGVIEINSIPEDTTAFVNGEQVGLSGNRIQNILTGKVKLRLQKQGYTPWEKLIEVNSDKITYVYAQLYPVELKREQILSQNIHSVVYSQDRSKLIFTVLDSNIAEEIGIWKLELNPNFPLIQNPQPTKIFALNSDLRNTLRTFPYRLSISPDDSYLMLDVPDLKIITRISLNALNESINLEEIIGFYPESVMWFGDSNTLLIKRDNLLYEQKLTSAQKNIIYFNPDIAPIFSTGKTGLILLDKSNSRLLYYTNGNFTTIKIPTTVPDQRINTETIVDPTNIEFTAIESLHLAYQNQSIFVIFINNQALYVNLESNIVRVVPNVSRINEVSSDGQSFLYESQGNTVSFIFDKVSKKSNTSILEPITDTSTKFYSDLGKQLLDLTKSSNLYTVSVSDVDGNNKIMLASDLELLNESAVFMHTQGTQLYLVINSSGITENNNFNLYKIELEL